jgi:hypothetical protein
VQSGNDPKLSDRADMGRLTKPTICSIFLAPLRNQISLFRRNRPVSAIVTVLSPPAIPP